MLQLSNRDVSAGRTPVDRMLHALGNLRDDYHPTPELGYQDDYIQRLKTYLCFAREHGQAAQAIVNSCIDLAETVTATREVVAARQDKQARWDAARQAALATNRPPRTIGMELDPIYFAAILGQQKTFEGRAYKPDSDKHYPDIRPGDSIAFRLSQRSPEFAADTVRRGLSLGAVMLCGVRSIHFAPTVHGMYRLPEVDAVAFQPMIGGGSELLQLQRAAVYHSFPGYHDLISAHGFLGIGVSQPQLL